VSYPEESNRFPHSEKLFITGEYFDGGPIISFFGVTNGEGGNLLFAISKGLLFLFLLGVVE